MSDRMEFTPWFAQATLYEMNVRQLTPEGTLCAATKRLEFLHAIGIEAIWLMPIYPIGVVQRKGTLGSYYSIRDYQTVNPDLGTMADFDAFVHHAHTLGMKVLLDWVANHTARDARWLSEKPADWYERDAEGEPLVPCDWSDTAKLNYANRAVWEGQIEAMTFWLQAHAIDGFRCDMAMLVPLAFWQEVSLRLRRVKPDLFLIAEAEEPHFFEDAFDACYGWKMHHLLNDIAQQKTRLWPLREWLVLDRKNYPQSAIRLAFTSNHDENSWSGSEFTRLGAATEVMAALTFLWPRSMPLVYTGQEVGYDHSFAFFDRDSIPAECYTANDTTKFYHRMVALRRNNIALNAGVQGGEAVEIHTNAEDCLLVLVREKADNCVIGILNLSPYAIQADFNTGIYTNIYTNAMTGCSELLPPHVNEILSPWSYRILTRTKE
ncbi:MAG: alpha-amylase family glycosyl hydrolase [Alistipes sp.]